MTIETQDPARSASLRERKKLDKRGRIMAAASELFAEHGYESVTTAAIAAAAQVGVGTLFRYAGSKSELLVAVMNERFAEGVSAGRDAARTGASVEDSVLAILAPLARESIAHPENMVAFEREALFGSAEHRASATERVSQVEAAILAVLQERGAGPRIASATLADVAHAIYATLYLDIVKVGAGRTNAADLPDRVRHTVSFLVASLLDDDAGSSEA
jgi:AcrR family transcriptional regulator